MNRRIFLKRAIGGVLLTSSAPLLPYNPSKPLRFGIVTDIHYSERASYGTRYFKQSIEKLKNAIDVFNQDDLDFIIELGDLKDQDNEPERENTLKYLDTIEAVLQTFNGPVYHVLGNHDVDSISKEDFLNHTSNHGDADKKTYYSFTSGRVKCIVLDANYNEDSTPYDTGNFDWTKAYIPKNQQEWLQKELSSDNKFILIFIHQLLDNFSGVGEKLYVGNADEVMPLLEKSGNVLAVFQGHHHSGNYSFRNDIHYWTMKGMIEGDLPDNNSFAIMEVNQHGDISIDGFFNCEDRMLKKNNAG